MIRLPVVAVVGRPNVGKSTLINRICQSSELVVQEKPGSTRDRKYMVADWRGRLFQLVDTGGLDLRSGEKLHQDVVRQATLAMEEADLILFLVDGKEGLLPSDLEVASALRKVTKLVFLVVNKIDNPEDQYSHMEFYSLGFGDPIAISALHGIGVGDLLDGVVKYLPVKEGELKVDLSIAIVGRPNVGKSSLLNRILGQERVIVSNLPGTTRDAIDTVVKMDDLMVQFVDTAGIRTKKSGYDDVDYYSVIRTYRSLERGQIALVVIDGSTEISRKDVTIGWEALKRGCSIIFVLNKWDKLAEEERLAMNEAATEKLADLAFAPVVRVSAKTGMGLNKLLKTIFQIFQERSKKISTKKLNELLQEIAQKAQTAGFSALKLKYMSQIKTDPPTFILFLKNVSKASEPFRRFVINNLRARFGFSAAPIRLILREAE
ncbi:GTPase [Candidatus Hakubella thermalkaliphila]|uniref:GTPase Der n=1 Tax=Candidatus Hakubella thermalkaliphila TaxID=2754717 RepID=A0A6V8NND5_9ACTN|nr:ribosome biogenesis GTPase Der [Candidatus Hakubella thermalkaliphila]GFP21623.1 GTPase [Candidatus Hakubella thermalkaliphila]